MPEFVINSGGLGAAAASDQAQQCTATGYASYLFNPACWGQSYESWQAQFYGPNTLDITTPVAPGTPSTALSDPNAILADTTGATAAALAAQALAQTQANNAAANVVGGPDSCQTISNDWPYPFGNMDCPTMLLWGLGALAALFIVPKVLFK